MQRIFVNNKQVEQGMHEMRRDVEDLAFQQRQDKVERWLSPPDPSTNYNEALRQRQEGTGDWLLRMAAFENWKMQQNSFLWLYGIPGCGKTILGSTVVEDLEKSISAQPLLYFYFSFKDTGKQTLASMVRSLISQIYCKCAITRKSLDLLFSFCEDGRRQPSCESLCKVLLQMMEQIKEVWVVLDALDECRTRAGSWTEGLLRWITELLNSEKRNVHLLVTSRPEHDIKTELGSLTQNEETMVSIQSDLIKDDIQSYIREEVRQGNGLKRWRFHSEVQDLIETRLKQKANGM